jgi:hypothetical protein
MLTLGSYTTGRVLAGAGFCARFEAALSAEASVAGARAPEGRFGKSYLATAISPTVIAPWLPRAGIDEEARRLVGAARDQAQLVGAGVKRWSIIADFGLLDDGRGAFVVRPTQPWSVERLALAKYRVSSTELRGIALGVLEGLLELEKFSARPWGNLNSATVMLAVGPGESRLADGTAVTLTDLESRERLPEDANLDDLRALGRLIYELVLHKRPPLKASTGWSATWSDAWESIGDGRFWFEFTNRLMTAGTAIGSASGEINRPPSLSLLRQEILEHRPHKPLPKRQLAIVGGLAAALVLSAGGYFVFRTPPREQIVLTADQLDEAARLTKWQGLIDRWYGSFGSVYADRDKVIALAADQPPTSTIRSIADLLQDPALRDPRQIAGSAAGLLDLRDNPGDAIAGEKIIAASASLEKVDELRARLIAWQELANLTTVKQVWDARGWSAATSDFDNIIRSVRAAVPTLANRTSAETEAPSPDGPIRAEPSRPPAPDTGELLRSILSSQSLIAAVAEIDARYDAVQKIAADAKPRGDATLPRLGDIIDADTKAALATVQTPADAIAALRQRSTTLAARAAEAAALDSGSVDGWDRAGFRASAAVKALASQPAAASVLDAWLTEARKAEYAKADGADPRDAALAAARAAVEETKSVRERLLGLAESKRELTMQPAELDARLKAVEAEIAALQATAWSNRNRAEVERRSRELTNDAASLARDATDAVTTGTVSLSEALRLINRSEYTSPTLAKVWNAAIDRAQSAPSKREAFATLRESREALVALDRAVPPRTPMPDAARALPGASESAWDDAWRTAREAAFAKALADAPIASRPDADRVGLAAAAVQQWRSDADAYLAAALRARESLRRAEVPTQPAFAAAITTIESSPVAAAVGRVLPETSDAVLALRAIADEPDTPRVAALLKAVIAAPKETSPGVALAAWSRLSRGGWPRTAAEFDEASRWISRELPALIDQFVPDEARSSARERLRTDASALWTAFFNTRRAADRTEIDAAMRDAGLFGVDPDSATLAPAARYNARLWQLAKRAAALAADADTFSLTVLADQTRAAADLLAQVRSVASDAGVASTASVQTLLSRLDVVAKREARPPFDPLINGPATIRTPSGRPVWRATRQGDAVVYSFDAGATRLAAPVQMAFLPVDIQGPDGPIATYVLAGEVSVGLFIAIAESTDAWGQFAGSREGQNALYWWDFDQGDPRSGPASWQWDRRRAKVVLSERPVGNRWLVGDESMTGKAYYPEALANTAPPALDSPMNLVSPDAALLAARHAGARIPTVTEWKAALASAGGVDAATKSANRRDRTWKLQFDHVASLDTTIRKEWPHAGIFWPRGLRPEWAVDAKNLYLNRRDDSALESSDGFLWFASSSHDSANWSNLIGNVAEYVVDTAPDALANVDPDLPAVRSAIDRTVEKWSVIGASALSGLTLRGNTPAKLDAPYAIPSLREARMGYSDVGFRLAFSEGGTGRPKEPPAVLAARAFAEAAYLDPK